MAQIIEGLHFDITTAELQDHFQERFSYHINRADEYKAQVKLYTDMPDEVNNMSGGNPKDQMEKSVKRHLSAADKFEFMSLHLVDGAKYRMSDSELYQIELLSRNDRY